MRRVITTTTRGLIIAMATLCLAATAGAQPTQSTQKLPTGAPKVTAMQLKGVVVAVKGNHLVVRMEPSGEYRLFITKPGQTATIDGKVTPMTNLAPGTSLTASVAMMETPVVDRTVATLTGTVWQAGPTTVVLTLANGENHQYDVPAGMKFNVDGVMKEAMELRPGMKVTATKVVESPRMELATDAVVTGTTKP
ncbi:hypothetical protein LuPra_01572 [Luteitalea pratensis]|uniref:DUF5666 domain-containing protein n=1 Tax=Luteitalea pratensis TaxID=1855912 RepID=A0A143PIH2_LUTPR|nr:hypothetical protein [Luteitalea pratensis]AMY08372.1 hypothetical protein LuPra_01572 [Luteitalea pratensis]